jgi:Transposase IS66 family
LCALVVHLHATQAIGFERLAQLLDEVFGVSISEGALVNILARAKAPLARAAEPIAAAVRQSAVVGSDETTARVAGKTWWQWVLLGSTAICHVIVPSRAAAVAEDFRQGHRPQIWVADRYAAQIGHGAARQLCLAHLRRDAQYAIDAGDSLFAFGFKLLLLRAMAIGRRRPTLKDSTLIWSVGSTACCPVRRPTRQRPPGCSTPCGATATTCSASSPAATCRTPTTPVNERCARRSSSARSPAASARRGAPRSMPPPLR